jgi:hypothetical protein
VIEPVVVYVRSHDRHSKRLVRWLEQALWPPVRVVDVEKDAAAATFVARLSCCGQVTPAVAVGKLILYAPSRRDVLDAVQRHDPRLLRDGRRWHRSDSEVTREVLGPAFTEGDGEVARTIEVDGGQLQPPGPGRGDERPGEPGVRRDGHV